MGGTGDQRGSEVMTESNRGQPWSFSTARIRNYIHKERQKYIKVASETLSLCFVRLFSLVRPKFNTVQLQSNYSFLIYAHPLMLK